jgi:hypothetical protein
MEHIPGKKENIPAQAQCLLPFLLASQSTIHPSMTWPQICTNDSIGAETKFQYP